jgi:hypothetical protein
VRRGTFTALSKASNSYAAGTCSYCPGIQSQWMTYYTDWKYVSCWCQGTFYLKIINIQSYIMLQTYVKRTSSKNLLTNHISYSKRDCIDDKVSSHQPTAMGQSFQVWSKSSENMDQTVQTLILKQLCVSWEFNMFLISTCWWRKGSAKWYINGKWSDLELTGLIWNLYQEKPCFIWPNVLKHNHEKCPDFRETQDAN